MVVIEIKFLQGSVLSPFVFKIFLGESLITNKKFGS